MATRSGWPLKKPADTKLRLNQQPDQQLARPSRSSVPGRHLTLNNDPPDLAALHRTAFHTGIDWVDGTIVIRLQGELDMCAAPTLSRDLTEAVKTLAARYHDEWDPGGRSHRLVVVAHPLPHKPATQEPS